MPQFVAMEREHGSLIAALQSKQRSNTPKPIFTSLRNGIASLTEALIERLPAHRIHRNVRAKELLAEDFPGSFEWSFWIDKQDVQRASGAHGLSGNHVGFFDHLILATSLDTARNLLRNWDSVQTTLLPSSGSFTSLAPTEASSAILAAFAWPADLAAQFTIPPGFGFLVPTTELSSRPEAAHFAAAAERPLYSSSSQPAPNSPAATEPSEPLALGPIPSLLACTFVDQKFPHRAPANARILRAFFGGQSATTLATQSDAQIAAAALTQLRQILGPMPDPTLTTVRRLPRSLPQYEVGHLDRIKELEFQLSRVERIHLLGNAYRGVGLPDLIRDARTTARAIATP